MAMSQALLNGKFAVLLKCTPGSCRVPVWKAPPAQGCDVTFSQAGMRAVSLPGTILLFIPIDVCAVALLEKQLCFQTGSTISKPVRLIPALRDRIF